MPKAVKNLFALTAAAGLALTPIAAQANTRAGDSGTIYSSAPSQSQSQPGYARAADGEELGGRKSRGDWIAKFLLGLWIAGIIVIIIDPDGDDDENQSPGAN